MSSSLQTAKPNQPPQVLAPRETRFIARQPILDCKQAIYAYELLFRSGADISFADGNAENATRSTIDLSLLLGAESFTEGLPAFINCTRESLCPEIAGTLPKDLVILEILEDVPADDETVRECYRLKQAGYRIALTILSLPMSDCLYVSSPTLSRWTFYLPTPHNSEQSPDALASVVCSYWPKR